jgi:hypothetical protein
MKKLSITICAAFLVACSLLLASPARPERKVDDAVVTVYTVVETNWMDNGATSTLMWPPEANTTTYNEMGTVSSNTYLRVQWRGHDHAVQIESVPFAFEVRSYTLETRRNYK